MNDTHPTHAAVFEALSAEAREDLLEALETVLDAATYRPRDLVQLAELLGEFNSGRAEP